jgi:hypothetical protein
MCNEKEAGGGKPRADKLSLAHATYLVATGLWPLVSMRTFQVVTGPKLEPWLVKMVGLLAGSIGVTIGVAGARGRPGREVALLGTLSALSFAAVDLWYAGHRRRIKKTYLLDAPVELALAASWIARLVRS